MRIISRVSIISATLLYCHEASAIFGYKSLGAGDRIGTAGAGVAYAFDATDPAVNPALVAFLQNQFYVSAGVLHVDRSMDTSKAPIGNPAGKSVSHEKNYPDLSLGVRYSQCKEWSFGFSITGTGLGTKYPKSRINPQILRGNYDSRLLYRIFNANPTLAVKIMDGRMAFGVSPTISYSDFKSNAAVPLPNGALAETKGRNRRDHAWGIGLRVGATAKLHEQITFGIAGQTPTYYQRFDKYKDLLISRFNFPATFTAGFAITPIPCTVLLLDYEYVHYKGSKLLRKTPDQGGFGWKNLNIFKIGLVQQFKDFTARLGYSYANSPIPQYRAFANVLAPAIAKHHIGAGLTYKMDSKNYFSLSGYYSPKEKETDPGTGGRFSTFGKGTRFTLSVFGVQAAYKRNF